MGPVFGQFHVNVKGKHYTYSKHDKYDISHRFVVFRNNKELINFNLSGRNVPPIEMFKHVKKNVI